MFVCWHYFSKLTFLSQRDNILRLCTDVIQFPSTNGETFSQHFRMCPHGFYYFYLLRLSVRWYNKEVSKCHKLNTAEFIFLSYKWIDCPGFMGWGYCSNMASPSSSRHFYFSYFPGIWKKEKGSDERKHYLIISWPIDINSACF